MPLPRVVADSNIIVSAAYLGGTPERVLHLARRGEIALFYSTFILEEVTRILTGKKFRWSDARVHDALASFPAIFVTFAGRRLRVAQDDADNRILECAVAARADYLVTGDRHLLDVGHYFRTEIVTARQFLSEVSAKKP
jgi:putative PIN family toxin of toxin-antitoxin system